MNKHEATSLLKEILRECELSADSFILVEPNTRRPPFSRLQNQDNNKSG